MRVLRLLAILGLTLTACNDDDDDDKDACVPGTVDDGCAEGLVCEETESGEPACFVPVVIRGRVFDLTTDAGIEGALVVARDANGAAMGAVAKTAADGTYSLSVPVKRTDEEGSFEGEVLTLRVDAAGYASYPGAFRPPLPVDLDDAAEVDTEIVVQTSTTDVALIPLKGDTTGAGSISGTVPEGAGALVVAEGSGSPITGVADMLGIYTIFNVAAGSYTLKAYAGGVQYEPLAVDVAAGQEVEDADFTVSTKPLATVTGSVNIVNAPGGSMTSVVLVVESTFSETFARGEVPPGLRAGEVTGAFEIPDVPDGKYVVLAAFENDDMVRDPNPTIGGTQIVHIETTGQPVAMSESFKVTEALAVKEPGAEAPEAVIGTPSFTWADDSSEDGYEVVIYDSFGQLVWEDLDIPGVSGDQWVTHPYGGPALEPGMYYQWRATWIKKGTPISMTEDLRGLFYLSP